MINYFDNPIHTSLLTPYQEGLFKGSNYLCFTKEWMNSNLPKDNNTARFNLVLLDTNDNNLYKTDIHIAYEECHFPVLNKDFSYVERSTMCITNLNQYDEKKPILGSFFELAWYYTMPSKVVVGVFSGDPTPNIHTNHPFVRAAVNVWVQNEIEAAELLRYYYEDK